MPRVDNDFPGGILKRTTIVAGAFVAGLFITPTAFAETVTVPTPVGTVTGSGDPATQSGYVVADGNGANGGPSGYVGISSSEGVVGCWSGDYDPAGGNNVVTAIPPTGAPEQPDPAGPCTPAP